MSKQRLSVSVDADLLRAAEEAVLRARAPNLSAWVSTALKNEIERIQKLDGLARFVAGYEEAHGEITPNELRAAGRKRSSNSRRKGRSR